MRYRLPDNSVVGGDDWVLIGEVQYVLSRLSPAERAGLGVTDIEVPTYDPVFYELVDYVATPRSLADIKETLKARVADERWQREVSGFELNGVRIPTDETTRSVITAAYLMASQDSNFSIPNFKLPAYTDSEQVLHPSTFITLSNAQILGIGVATVAFIQSCFDMNKTISDSIDALQSFEDAVNFSWSWEV